MQEISSKLSTEEIIGRLLSIYKVKTESELSTILNVKRSTFGSWKARNSIPYALCVDVCNDLSIDLMWLLTGQSAAHLKSENILPETSEVHRFNN